MARTPVASAHKGPTPLLSRPPFNTLWTVYLLTRFLASAPFLFFYFLIPTNRGTPKRTVKQELSFSMIRAIFKWVTDIRWPMPRPVVPGKAWKDQFVFMEPAKDDTIYQGVARDEFVHPEPVPAVWFPHRPQAPEIKDNQRVVMHFHGGAYATGSYDPQAVETTCNMLVEGLSAFVLSAGYRKSSTAGWHFPAQLQDAITTYAYLLEQGVKPANIILSGSSSGGHLQFNLLRYILENPSTRLPKPAAVVTSSPWVDLLTSDYTAYHSRPNFPKDYIDMPFISWARNTFIPPGADVAGHSYLSIMHHPFTLGGVPAWMCIGSDEVPSLDLIRFAQEMEKVEGNVFEIFECPDAPHDVMWTGTQLGFLEDARTCVEKLREFLEKYRV